MLAFTIVAFIFVSTANKADFSIKHSQSETVKYTFRKKKLFICGY